MARAGMGVAVLLSVLLPFLLPVLPVLPVLPAADRGIRTAGSTGRADKLLVLLPEPSGILPVCETVSERLDEGSAVSSKLILLSAEIRG